MKNILILSDQFTDQWLKFENPVQIIEAFSLAEVVSAIRIIDQLSKENFYLAGFISYEAAPAFDPALHVKQQSPFPLFWFGIYEKASNFEPRKYKKTNYKITKWESSVDREKYKQAITQIKEQIADGYTYQVNYTYRLNAGFKGDPFSFFLDLIDRQKVPYAAYIETGYFIICSVSPELFFQLDGDSITARPMKGTASRGRYLAEDTKKKRWLKKSPKNRAENIMIVDMIRNDLGRIAETGSIQVHSLYDIETYPSVLQMTSTIHARTSASVSQILTAMFPCASVTGAPKAQTMKIIAELETTPRQIYTGCIGFIQPQRKAQFNVAIRTALIDRERSRIEYGIGGGVVWESDADLEYKESLVKARVLSENKPRFRLLETILWTTADGYFLINYHLKRLQHSAMYFKFQFDVGKIKQRLKMKSRRFFDKHYRVRLFLSEDGRITIKTAPLENTLPKKPVRLSFAGILVDSSDPMLFHKTTHRKVYDRAKHSRPDCDDVILLNERGEITETCIYNIVLKVGKEYLTPPLNCGLLAGTFRAWLLDRGKIKEKRIKKKDLYNCDQIYVINSVRKWQKAVLVKNNKFNY